MTTVSSSPIEPSGKQFQEILQQVGAHLAKWLDTVQQEPVTGHDNCYQKSEKSISEKIEFPKTGNNLANVLDDLFNKKAKSGIVGSSGGYLSFVGGGGLPIAAVADMISGILNRYTGLAQLAPEFVEMEVQVVKMFCSMIGYPSTSHGILTSGGSMAHWSGLAAAVAEQKHRHALDEKLHLCTAYFSDQVHYCIPKALKLCGIPKKNMRSIPSDEEYRIDLAALQQQIENDKQSGLVPIILVANAGTVNTGAIDPFEPLHHIAASHGMWLHADGCYGGMFMLTEYGKKVMKGIELCDSVVVDQHKGMFLPYGTASLLVKDAKVLKNTFTTHVEASYIPPTEAVDISKLEFYNFSELSPELSRPYRGLRIWLPLQLYGIEPFEKQLDEKLSLARWLYEKVGGIKGIEIISGNMTLTTFAFQYVGKVPSGASAESKKNREESTKSLLQVLRKGSTMNTYYPSIFHGVFAIRICVIALRTHKENVEACFHEIQHAVHDLTQVDQE